MSRTVERGWVHVGIRVSSAKRKQYLKVIVANESKDDIIYHTDLSFYTADGQQQMRQICQATRKVSASASLGAASWARTLAEGRH